MIHILVNDDETMLEQGCTLDGLLRQMSMDQLERIAIAVNDTVIRRSDWACHQLNENDRVLVIAPIQGG